MVSATFTDCSTSTIVQPWSCVARPVSRSCSTVDEARYGLEQRGLAGAVGAEQGDDLPLLNVQVDAEQHLHLVVGDVDTATREEGLAVDRPTNAVPVLRRRPPRQADHERLPRARASRSRPPPPASLCRCSCSAAASSASTTPHT